MDSGGTQIDSERLELRDFVSADADMIFALNSNREVMRYMPEAAKLRASLIDAELMIERAMDYYEEHPGLGIWPTLLKSTGDCIGWTCLKHLDHTNEIELGYRFFPEHWGQGLCTEISRELIRYGFEQLGLTRIVGITHPENLASRRVLEKVGMTHERNDHYYGIDVVYYARNQSSNTKP